jgi:hypothetical protein
MLVVLLALLLMTNTASMMYILEWLGLICTDGTSLYFARRYLRNPSVDKFMLHHELLLVTSWCSSTARTHIHMLVLLIM